MQGTTLGTRPIQLWSTSGALYMTWRMRKNRNSYSSLQVKAAPSLSVSCSVRNILNVVSWLSSKKSVCLSVCLSIYLSIYLSVRHVVDEQPAVSVGCVCTLSQEMIRRTSGIHFVIWALIVTALHMTMLGEYVFLSLSLSQPLCDMTWHKIMRNLM